MFCSGHDPEMNQAASITEQGLPLLQKPVDAGLLLHTLRSVLDAPDKGWQAEPSPAIRLPVETSTLVPPALPTTPDSAPSNRRDASLHRIPAMSHRNRPAAGPLGNILILDDQSCVRGLIGRWLTTAGYRCAEARNSGEAWELLARQDFQLITLDICLLGESGLDLVHQLKREYAQLAILMVTGSEVAIGAVQALTRGAFGCLIKPLDRDALLFHVRAGLEQRQQKIDEHNYLRWLEQSFTDEQAVGGHDSRMLVEAVAHMREARWSAN